MKYFVFLFVAVGITGVVFGDVEGGVTVTEEGGVTVTEEGGEPSTTSPLSGCRFDSDQDEVVRNPLHILFDAVYQCINNPGRYRPFSYQLRDDKNIQELVTTTRRFCLNESVPVCMEEEVLKESKIHLNSTIEQDMIRINMAFALNVREVICEDEGVRLAIIINEARSANITSEPFQECHDDAISFVGRQMNDDVSLFSLLQYRSGEAVKKCVSKILGSDTPAGLEADSLLSAILSKSPCINEEGEKVLCQTLNP